MMLSYKCWGIMVLMSGLLDGLALFLVLALLRSFSTVFPGKPFIAEGVLRQGDPLSPLLYVATADLFQSVINKACQMNLLQHPIPSVNGDFPIIQYADDTLLNMQACSRQLLCLKALLEILTQSTGLRVNFAKSCLLPINLSNEKAALLAGLFGCKLGTFPFTYLGLPLGLCRPRIRDLGPLYSRINHRLAATSSFLSLDGRANWKIQIDQNLWQPGTYFACQNQKAA
jgi:hypothetical protein